MCVCLVLVTVMAVTDSIYLYDKMNFENYAMIQKYYSFW